MWSFYSWQLELLKWKMSWARLKFSTPFPARLDQQVEAVVQSVFCFAFFQHHPCLSASCYASLLVYQHHPCHPKPSDQWPMTSGSNSKPVARKPLNGGHHQSIGETPAFYCHKTPWSVNAVRLTVSNCRTDSYLGIRRRRGADCHHRLILVRNNLKRVFCSPGSYTDLPTKYISCAGDNWYLHFLTILKIKVIFFLCSALQNHNCYMLCD